MTLDEFMLANEISTPEGAIRLERDQTVVGRYRRREINPSPKIMAEIWEWSGGQVTPPEMVAVTAAAIKEAAE